MKDRQNNNSDKDKDNKQKNVIYNNYDRFADLAFPIAGTALSAVTGFIIVGLITPVVPIVCGVVCAGGGAGFFAGQAVSNENKKFREEVEQARSHSHSIQEDSREHEEIDFPSKKKFKEEGFLVLKEKPSSAKEHDIISEADEEKSAISDENSENHDENNQESKNIYENHEIENDKDQSIDLMRITEEKSAEEATASPKKIEANQDQHADRPGVDTDGSASAEDLDNDFDDDSTTPYKNGADVDGANINDDFDFDDDVPFKREKSISNKDIFSLNYPSRIGLIQGGRRFTLALEEEKADALRSCMRRRSM